MVFRTKYWSCEWYYVILHRSTHRATHTNGAIIEQCGSDSEEEGKIAEEKNVMIQFDQIPKPSNNIKTFLESCLELFYQINNSQYLIHIEIRLIRNTVFEGRHCMIKRHAALHIITYNNYKQLVWNSCPWRRFAYVYIRIEQGVLVVRGLNKPPFADGGLPHLPNRTTQERMCQSMQCWSYDSANKGGIVTQVKGHKVKVEYYYGDVVMPPEMRP